MEGDATAERRYLQSPVSALKYLQRPSDPLKDGSIFQIRPRLSRNSAGLPLTDTRLPSSLPTCVLLCHVLAPLSQSAMLSPNSTLSPCFWLSLAWKLE